MLKERARQVVRRTGLRQKLAAARVCGERHALATLRRGADNRPRILCYHSTGTRAWGINDVPAELFARHLEQALRDGRRFVPAATIAAGQGKPGDLAITFDDGLVSVCREAAPILGRLGIPFTMFIVGEWTEGRHGFGDGVLMGWREVEWLARQPGASIGAHSMTHPNFGRLDRERAEWEIRTSRALIEERAGLAVSEFAIPYGQSKNWPAADQAIARSAGFEFVYAQSETRRPAGTIPRTFITRFDSARLFGAALNGSFDRWEEWF